MVDRNQFYTKVIGIWPYYFTSSYSLFQIKWEVLNQNQCRNNIITFWYSQHALLSFNNYPINMKSKKKKYQIWTFNGYYSKILKYLIIKKKAFTIKLCCPIDSNCEITYGNCLYVLIILQTIQVFLKVPWLSNDHENFQNHSFTRNIGKYKKIDFCNWC